MAILSSTHGIYYTNLTSQYFLMLQVIRTGNITTFEHTHRTYKYIVGSYNIT